MYSGEFKGTIQFFLKQMLVNQTIEIKSLCHSSAKSSIQLKKKKEKEKSLICLFWLKIKPVFNNNNLKKTF